MQPNDKILKLELNADTKVLAYLRSALNEFLSKNNFPEQKILEVQLVVDEFCSNIINYSYNNDPTKKFLVIVEIIEQSIKIQIIDQGKPFDITKYKAPNISEHIKNPHKGGLGIPFIKLFSSEIKYSRDPHNPELNLTEITI